MILHVGKQQFVVESLADSSASYQRFRGTQSSTHVPEGVVRDATGSVVARVSYNGRVWGPGPWRSGAEPILEATDVDA